MRKLIILYKILSYKNNISILNYFLFFYIECVIIFLSNYHILIIFLLHPNNCETNNFYPVQVHES